MKRFMAILLAVGLLCSLWGCGAAQDARAALSVIEDMAEAYTGTEASAEEPEEVTEASAEEPVEEPEEVHEENPEALETDEPETGSGQITDTHITLEEYAGFTYKDLSFTEYAVYATENEQKVCYTYSGEMIGTYEAITTTRVEFPYVICGEYNGTENSFGLYSVLDGLIIPCEAGMFNQLSERFMEVIYSTGVTDDEEACMYYTSDHLSLAGFGPQEDDIMYSGVVRVYDLYKQAFVPGIESTEGGTGLSVRATNDRVFLGKTIYDADGKVIEQLENSADCTFVSEGSYGINDVVYASDGTELFQRKNVKPISGTDEYFLYHESGEQTLGVLNRNGEVIIEAAYDNIPRTLLAEQLADGTVMAEKDDRFILLDLQGNVISEIEADTFNSYGYGIYSMGKYSGEFVYLLKNGEVVDMPEASGLICLIEKQEKDDYSAYVWDTESYDVTGKKYIDKIGDILVLAEEEDGTKSIYEVLHGECLWNGYANKLWCVEDYFFAIDKTNNLVTVFKVCQ